MHKCDILKIRIDRSHYVPGLAYRRQRSKPSRPLATRKCAAPMSCVPAILTGRGRHVATTFLQWMYMRSVVHRGYILTSGLYFVVTGHLSASQLVLLGTIMSLTLVVTGLVTTFPLLVVTQLLWGLGWAFLNGADSAWLNDELNDPHRIARVLTASARWDRAGGASGMIVLGLLAWATSLATAIVDVMARFAPDLACGCSRRHSAVLTPPHARTSRAVPARKAHPVGRRGNGSTQRRGGHVLRARGDRVLRAMRARQSKVSLKT